MRLSTAAKNKVILEIHCKIIELSPNYAKNDLIARSLCSFLLCIAPDYRPRHYHYRPKARIADILSKCCFFLFTILMLPLNYCIKLVLVDILSE